MPRQPKARGNAESHAAHVRSDPLHGRRRPSSSSAVNAPAAQHGRQRRAPAQTHQRDSWHPAHLHRFDPASGSWLPLALGHDGPLPAEAPLLAERRTNRLAILTYNTWSSAPTHTLAQSRAVLAVVRDARADVVALQEVTARFFALMCDEPWLRTGGWVLTTPDAFWRVAGKGAKHRGKDGESEACVLLVRQGLLGRGSELRMTRLERAKDEGGKAAIALKLFSHGEERVRLASSHFTSLPVNASLRARQYDTCLSFLSTPAPARSGRRPGAPLRLFLGDFNASTASELLPLSEPPHTLADACPSAPAIAAHAQPSGAAAAAAAAHAASFAAPPTFGHLYPWVTAHARKARKPRRIDRVYYAGEGARVRRYEHRGGEQAVEGRRDRTGRGGQSWASDHEAVRVEVEWGGCTAG
ncbi:hypothetical protein JCM3770_001142 [Rhodotorula araucariae]